MNNNDRLLRLRYALDIKDTDIIKAFELGGQTISSKEEKALLTKSGRQKVAGNDFEENIYDKMLDNQAFDAFLNGFILLKRGAPKNQAGQPTPAPTGEIKHINNVLLKKVKIALALTSEDLLDILAAAEVYPSKSELSGIMRKEGHRNFKPCGDNYTRNFLKGLALCYRD
ncbi:DUF1456 family protein [Enterococcus pseudoavium]|uniref:DUF1456 family protein n=1 Tax=Enterococcus pseudoavium TaxID=44007 RepID=A0AAE4L0K9_9ENTE|nr:DUF1456 family protein [Enterococcus pseudoavium]MDT2735826.1 DUF1456 family protein [Enterococcus pseudoavium]